MDGSTVLFFCPIDVSFFARFTFLGLNILFLSLLRVVHFPYSFPTLGVVVFFPDPLIASTVISMICD